MKEVLVLGCGSPFAGDDAVGLHVVRALKREGVPAGVSVVEAGTPGLNLLDLWEGCDRVVVVDAVQAELPPGTVRLFSIEELERNRVSPVSQHGFNLLDAVSLGRLLGRLPRHLVFLGIVAEECRPFQVGLSPKVEAAIPLACSLLRAEVLRLQELP